MTNDVATLQALETEEPPVCTFANWTHWSTAE